MARSLAAERSALLAPDPPLFLSFPPVSRFACLSSPQWLRSDGALTLPDPCDSLTTAYALSSAFVCVLVLSCVALFPHRSRRPSGSMSFPFPSPDVAFSSIRAPSRLRKPPGLSAKPRQAPKTLQRPSTLQLPWRRTSTASRCANARAMSTTTFTTSASWARARMA